MLSERQDLQDLWRGVWKQWGFTDEEFKALTPAQQADELRTNPQRARALQRARAPQKPSIEVDDRT